MEDAMIVARPQFARPYPDIIIRLSDGKHS